MCEPNPVRVRAGRTVVLPPEVWRHVKYFMLRGYWRRKYREAVAGVPRCTVLSTWTRKWWTSWRLVPHPNWNGTALRRSFARILVDYERRVVDAQRGGPGVLGPQEALHMVVEHRFM